MTRRSMAMPKTPLRAVFNGVVIMAMEDFEAHCEACWRSGVERGKWEARPLAPEQAVRDVIEALGLIANEPREDAARWMRSVANAALTRLRAAGSMERTMNDKMKMLDMSDPDFPDQLMDAIGVKPGDTVEIVTPTFDRKDGVVPSIPDAWELVPKLYAKTLKAIGCCPWDEPSASGEQLWLFPAEWYPHIPAGFEITDINGQKEKFVPGVTDDDKRFGVLAYGVMINVNEQPDAAVR